MRIDISSSRRVWLQSLDYRKIIVIAFLLRLIFACVYDIYVAVSDTDILLPDSKFYSINGKYISFRLNGYDKQSFTTDMTGNDLESRNIFLNILKTEKGALCLNEVNLYCAIIGFLYFVFGYFPLAVRILNILLSIGSAYFLFKIAKRHFGDLVANVFISIALFLPTQFGYSITLSKDVIRMFIISFLLWGIYGWKKI